MAAATPGSALSLQSGLRPWPAWSDSCGSSAPVSDGIRPCRPSSRTAAAGDEQRPQPTLNRSCTAPRSRLCHSTREPFSLAGGPNLCASLSRKIQGKQFPAHFVGQSESICRVCPYKTLTKLLPTGSMHSSQWRSTRKRRSERTDNGSARPGDFDSLPPPRRLLPVAHPCLLCHPVGLSPVALPGGGAGPSPERSDGHGHPEFRPVAPVRCTPVAGLARQLRIFDAP